MIPCHNVGKAKSYQESKLLKGIRHTKTTLDKHEILNGHKILSVRELNMKYLVHTKGHYGIEDPELKFSRKGLQEDSYQRNKNSNSTKLQVGMGMRNKRIMLLTIYYNPMVSKLETT